MKETVNITNFKSDIEMISADSNVLLNFLQKHRLDGIELMLCDKWDSNIFPKDLIVGNHLPFYPNWMDFWLGKKDVLQLEFGTEETIIAQFGGLDRESWLEKYRQQILAAGETEPEYMVFHVGNVRYEETFSWNFYYDDEAVIDATLDVLEELSDCIPSDTWLLLENLWWPGLRLTDRHLAEKIVAKSPHQKTGIMLDIGHLLATNNDIRTQEEGAAYIQQILKGLGELCGMIKGVHLHQSLPGEYLREQAGSVPKSYGVRDVARHVHRIDYHAPWSSRIVHEALSSIAPDWLTHEFLQRSLLHWDEQLKVQIAAWRMYDMET